MEENAIKGTQHINQTTYRLNVTGLNSLQLSYDDIVNNHQKYLKVTTLHCVEGWQAKILWEGVLVKDLLEESWINPSKTVSHFLCFRRVFDGLAT
jgi:DMSO/TMAO reductase YedYZ molybdopterin-dependent catalytic subunit